MRPHQFRRLMEFLREQFGAAHEAIDQQTDASINQHAASREEVRNITGVLGIIAQGMQAQDQKGDAAYDKSYGQQERLLKSQKWLVIWASLAFWAAFGYGAVALWQGIMMRQTYREIKSQTRAANQSAYMACLSAQAAQESIAEIERSARDSHAASVAAITQTTTQIESQRALVRFIPAPQPQKMELQIIQHPSNQMAVFDYLGEQFTLKNEGRSNANFSLWFQGVFVKPGEALVLAKDGSAKEIKNAFIQVGEVIPGKGADPIFVSFEDSKKRLIPWESPLVKPYFADGVGLAAVFGVLQYSDSWGSYTVRFCDPLFDRQSSTSSLQQKNAAACIAYNHEESHYRDKPNIEPLTALTFRPESIACTAPKD